MTTVLRPFLYKVGENITAPFRARNLLWLAAAVLLTLALVRGGFDGWWFAHTRSALVFALFIPVGALGFLVPIIAPVIAFTLGAMRKDARLVTAGYALVQSAALAWVLSSFLKFFTGRAHPTLWGSSVLEDASRLFRFGFGEGGIFWGWPSSHAAVACAVAATAIALYAANMRVKITAFAFAVYVTVGVSLTFHWFSDAVAGAIVGTIIGVAVGRSFAARAVTKFSSSSR